MPILSTLRKDGMGAWGSLDEFNQALRRRESGAIGALASALGAEPSEQKELGQDGGGEYLVDIASDLRVPKGARLAGARCALEAGLPEELLAELLLGGGDLVTDPRLGGHARKLAELGIPAALARAEKTRTVSNEAGAFARAAHAAASVLGQARVKELLAAGPPGHAGISAALFALGTELGGGDRAAWEKLFSEQCAAHKRAPAAARRMGLAPPWPPFLPEAFAPLIKAAEDSNAAVTSTDVLQRPLAKTSSPAPPAPAQLPLSTRPNLANRAALPAAPPRMSTQVVGTRPLAPAIRQGGFRRPTGALIEGTTEKLPPRTMPAVLPQMSASAPRQEPSGAGGARPGAIGAPMSAAAVAQARAGGAPSPEKVPGPGAGPASANAAASAKATATAASASATATAASATASAARQGGKTLVPTPAAYPAAVAAAIAAQQPFVLPGGESYGGKEPLRFDVRGKRIPRSDRWSDDAPEWAEPILPASKMRDPGRAALVLGPFAARLSSLFEDRPEAVDRLCAAAEARAALAGDTELISELTRELGLPRWAKKRAPEGQLARLRTVVAGADRPASWRRAAEALLAALARGRDDGRQG